MTSQWFSLLESNAAPQLRLYVFAHAGAGHTAYQHWRRYFPASIELALIKLPGRGTRFSEPVVGDLSQLAVDIANALPVKFSLPFAFFGHSMGALLAFEVCNQLHADGHPLPTDLFVSGATAPHLSRVAEPLSVLSDMEFRQAILAINGIPAEIAADDSLLDFFLPIIRQDLRLCENYRYRERAPLPIHLHAFGGTDDPHMSVDALTAWRLHTLRNFSMRWFAGDHFYLTTQTQIVTDLIARQVSALLSPENRWSEKGVPA